MMIEEVKEENKSKRRQWRKRIKNDLKPEWLPLTIN